MGTKMSVIDSTYECIATGVVMLHMVRSVNRKRSDNCLRITAKQFLTKACFVRCVVLVSYQDLFSPVVLANCL